MNRRKGTPCSCECKPCGSKNPIRALNNISPDPNGDFTIKAGNGIGISGGDNEITIINQSMASSFIAGDNIEINPSGDDLEIRVKDDISVNDVDVGGDLRVTGDIIQQGSSYETHAEQIYTTKDYIYMREGAISGLSPGDYSGFEVIKYDGTNDGRLVIDSDGVARVGDVGDEQPLLTRDESNDLTDGQSLVWDGTNQKAVTEAIPGAISTALAGKENALSITIPTTPSFPSAISNTVTSVKYGKIVVVSGTISSSSTFNAGWTIMTLPLKPNINMKMTLINLSSGTNLDATAHATDGTITSTGTMSAGQYYGFNITYVTND